MARTTARVLLVISQFRQGGSERYLFELCSALDRRRFEPHILTRKDVDRNAFYFRRVTELGTPIHAIRPYVPSVQRVMPRVARTRAYRAARHRVSGLLARREIASFLRSFDLIACIQIENFLELQLALDGVPPTVVHLMSNRFQYGYDPYDELAPNRPYRFVAFNPSQVDEICGLPLAQTFRWPLSMDFRGHRSIPAPASGEEPFRIGIFTRISREKPVDPLLKAFKAVSSRVNATLHIYGSGDSSILAREIEMLGIGSRLSFEGHRPSVADAAASDGLSLCWLMSVGASLGYASIELAAAGMPMVFWNFGSVETAAIQAETGGAVQSFSSVPEFADFVVACLTDRARLLALGSRLKDYVLATHDIHKNIRALEDYYVRVMDEGRRSQEAPR